MKRSLIRIATRKSPLALWQAHQVGTNLVSTWPQLQYELLPLLSSGDNFVQDKLLALGGKGLFVKELEEALLDNRADIAVHSTKDVPATLPDGLHLAAICKRDNPLDALVSPQYTSLHTLPIGASVGTASLRRQAQLLAFRPDLRIHSLRGNITTRLTQVEQGAFDAIILAAAGLERLGLERHIKELISEAILLPACSQGALCLETRIDDEAINTLCAKLNHHTSALCVTTERLVNAQLGGSCHVPLAVYCTASEPNNSLHLQAAIYSLDGRTKLANSQKGAWHEAEHLAQQCTEALLAQGGAQMLRAYCVL